MSWDCNLCLTHVCIWETKFVVVGRLIQSLRSDTYGAPMRNASAETRDNMLSAKKTTVKVAQRLTNVFHAIGISPDSCSRLCVSNYVVRPDVFGVFCWPIS